MAYTVVLGPEWDMVIARLADAEATGQDDIRDAVRDEIESKIIPEVREKALAIPTHGTKHTGLRGRLADGVGISGASGDSVQINASAFLSGGMDNPAGWRHPVYGHRNAWAHNEGHPWFKSTIRGDADDIESRLSRTLDLMAEKIAGH